MLLDKCFGFSAVVFMDKSLWDGTEMDLVLILFALEIDFNVSILLIFVNHSLIIAHCLLFGLYR